MSRPILLATGGTGGHIFPALSLAQELRSRQHRVVMITNKLAPALKPELDGLQFAIVPASTIFRAGLWRKFWGLLTIAYACFVALIVLLRFRPRLVLGFGGYPSFAPVFMARLLRFRAAVHEQNRVMGRANRVLASAGARVALSFAETAQLPAKTQYRAVVTGNPVRADVLALAKTAYQAPTRTGEIRLLVVGGSQGARLFGRVVPAALAQLPVAMRRRLRLTQQARAGDLARLLEFYHRATIQVELRDFFSDLPTRLAGAHFVITRGGASTLAEICALGRPSLIVPLAGSLDGDQLRNARALEAQKGCAVLTEQKFSAKSVTQKLEELFAEPQALSDMARGAQLQSQHNAATRLADYAEQILDGKGAV